MLIYLSCSISSFLSLVWMVLVIIITRFSHLICLVMFGENIFIVFLGLLLLRHGLPSHFLPGIQYSCTTYLFVVRWLYCAWQRGVGPKSYYIACPCDWGDHFIICILILCKYLLFTSSLLSWHLCFYAFSDIHYSHFFKFVLPFPWSKKNLILWVTENVLSDIHL